MVERSPVMDPRQTLERVLASRSFARAEQLRRLLSYIVEATLENNENSLKETVIGVDVFQLPANFNPKSDPTVRMAMRRLRSRLSQYYQHEGLQDSVVISLEPGRYTPSFVSRSEPAPQRVSITVLPFDSSREDAGDQDYGGFLREAILTQLGESPVFRLVGNESVSFTRGTDIHTIAEKLRVRYILRGAYFADSAKIRICTELVSPEQHEPVWLGNHEQVASDEVWTVQKEIAADLEKQVSAADVRERRPRNPETHEAGISRLILQGRYHLHQDNTESIRKAEGCFLAAAEKEPTSALAWAGISLAQSYMSIYHMAPAQKVWRQAKVAAEKAVTYAPALPEALLAQGLLSALTEFKPAIAGQHFERALTANPDDNSTRIVDAMLHLAPLGKLEEAEDQMELVLASDPLNARALRMMSTILYFQRRFETAAEVALSTLDITPQSLIAWFTLGNSYEKLGREEDALRAFRRCEELMPFLRVLKWPSVLAAVAKNRQKWVRPSVLAAAKLLQSSPRAPAGMVADLLVRLGEHERAIAWLERAFHERALRALYLAVDPAFDALRDHPRYQHLIDQLKGTEEASLAAGTCS